VGFRRGYAWRIEDGEELSPEYALNILEAVQLRSITSLTLYSNLLDLKNNKIYLHYMAQFNEAAVIDMEEEFSKSQRVLEMREFFSPETAAAGDANYRSFANRLLMIETVVIAVGILLVLGMVILIARKVQKKE
jgi:hypothetical protein